MMTYKRSALGPQGRPTGDRTPSLALDRNEVVRNKPGHLGQQLHLGGLDRAPAAQISATP